MFKTPSYRVFDYTPQYFDEKEEAIKKELKKKMFFEGLTEEEAQKAYHAEKMRLSFRRAQERVMERTISKRQAKGKDKTGFRVLIIFLVLCGIAWFILG